MSEKRTLIAATRKSALALAQCRAWLRELTRVTGVGTEELHVVTTGDRILDRPLNEVGGKGLFIKEIEAALLAGEAQIAVHSLKDVPGELAAGLHIACIPVREDPRDIIKTRSGCSLDELPKGAKVGTSSLRRRIQLAERRPDLEFVPVRGNVGTRLSRVDDGTVDAVVLAYAGLKRLGMADAVSEVLSPDVCLPAVGQGALAIEIRSEDEATRRLVAELDDTETALTTSAERGILVAVEGNCQIPVAGFAEKVGDEMRLRGFLAEVGGGRIRRQDRRFPWPQSPQAARELGLELGRDLLTGG